MCNYSRDQHRAVGRETGFTIRPLPSIERFAAWFSQIKLAPNNLRYSTSTCNSITEYRLLCGMPKTTWITEDPRIEITLIKPAYKDSAFLDLKGRQVKILLREKYQGDDDAFTEAQLSAIANWWNNFSTRRHCLIKKMTPNNANSTPSGKSKRNIRDSTPKMKVKKCDLSPKSKVFLTTLSAQAIQALDRNSAAIERVYEKTSDLLTPGKRSRLLSEESVESDVSEDSFKSSKENESPIIKPTNATDDKSEVKVTKESPLNPRSMSTEIDASGKFVLLLVYW
jgi:hypothetical protein